MSSDQSNNIYDLVGVDLYGKPLPFRQFEGRPLVIVNTASLCSYSHQLRSLEDIYRRMKSEGLAILGVPSNDFGRQEPGNSAEIGSLCINKFNVTFPFLQKARLVGPEIHPLFKWVNTQGGFLARPRWNYYKYVIDRKGQLKEWYSFLTDPHSNKFEGLINDVVRNSP